MAQRWLIALCLLVALTSTADAQRSGSGRFNPFARNRWLVDLPTVRAELGVSEAQADLLDALKNDLDRQREAIYHGDDAPRSSNRELEQQRRRGLAERLAAFDQDSETLITVVLKEDQARRLKQLYVQREGAEALDRPEVAAKLEITDEQRSELLKVRATFAKKLQETFMARRENIRNQSVFHETLLDADRLRNEELEEIQKLLNEEQQSRWKELRGDPFDFTTVSTWDRTRD